YYYRWSRPPRVRRSARAPRAISGGEGADDLLGERHDPGRLVVGARGVGRRVLLRGDKVDVAVERQFSLAAEPCGNLRRPVQAFADFCGELRPVLDEQAPDVVELGRLNPDRPQHPLQRQLNELLRLAHDVGVVALVT